MVTADLFTEAQQSWQFARAARTDSGGQGKVRRVRRHPVIQTKANVKQNVTVSWLVSWCFKASQPQRIISGLKETFIKRSIVERTNKAIRRPEEQSKKAESCWENL